MYGSIFFMIGVTAAVGLYFILPFAILLLPILTIPAFLTAFFLKIFSEESQKRGGFMKLKPSIMKKLYSTGYTIEYENLSDKEIKEVSRISKSRSDAILSHLPSDSSLKFTVSKKNDLWEVVTKATSLSNIFRVESRGFTPNEAFLLLEPTLTKAIQDWRATRHIYNSPEQFEENRLDMIDEAKMKNLNILIVDDDIDSATLAWSALKKTGCNTKIATSHTEALRCMMEETYDIVILDWDLGENMYASDLMEKVNNMKHTNMIGLDNFSNVITFSSTTKNELFIPESDQYTHTDHWMKPMTINQIDAKFRTFLENKMAI